MRATLLSVLKPTDAWSLRTQLACGAALMAVIATVALSLVIGAVTLNRLRADAGEAMLATALQMGETLSRGMSERFRDIQVLASLDTMYSSRAPLEQKRRLLDQMTDTFPDYAWVGVTDNDGKVLVSSGGILEGANVSQRPWFIDGRFGTIVKDVHDAVLLAKLLPADPSGEPLRFVDVATPLRDESGARVGVVGAHLSWSWASEVRDALLRTRSGGAELDIMVLATNGTLLLGPDALVGTTLQLESFKAASRGEQGYRVETWPDGGTYLTGYGRSLGYHDYPGLGWIVLVRQPTSIAFDSAESVQRYIVLGGGVTTLALAMGGWLGARRFTRPVLAIADAADRIAQSDQVALSHAVGDRVETIPAVAGSREVGLLGNSLRHLMDQVLHREKALIDLNLSLEQRITDRTESLLATNGELQREIELRGALEAERERLIKELRSQAETDSLTGLYNRRAFQELAQRELRRAQRQQSAAAVIMLDIDHFKRVNDTYGHPTGDAVIRAIAAVLRANLREVDIIGRLGGEEFAAMLVDCHPNQVAELAERLRLAVAAMEVPFEADILHVTASFGIAVARDDILRATHLDTLIALADKALYRAKAEGRNRVIADNTASALS